VRLDPAPQQDRCRALDARRTSVEEASVRCVTHECVSTAGISKTSPHESKPGDDGGATNERTRAAWLKSGVKPWIPTIPPFCPNIAQHSRILDDAPTSPPSAYTALLGRH
jgi:hypothetical protein